MDSQIIQKMYKDLLDKKAEIQNIQEQIADGLYVDQDDLDTLNFIEFAASLTAKQICENILKCVNAVDISPEEELKIARIKKEAKNFLGKAPRNNGPRGGGGGKNVS